MYSQFLSVHEVPMIKTGNATFRFLLLSPKSRIITPHYPYHMSHK